MGGILSDAFLMTVGINIILTLSLYIPFSAGQWSLGISAFMGLGAYTASVLTVKYHVPFLLAMPISGLFVGILGVIIAFPALRIKGIFLAIATLGLGEIVVAIFESWDYVGGLSGMSGMRGTTLTITYVIVAVCIFLSWKLANSRLGLLCNALRQDEVAADSLGVNCTLIKVLAFSSGACMTAIAGALSAHYMTYIEPSVFDFNAILERLGTPVPLDQETGCRRGHGNLRPVGRRRLARSPVQLLIQQGLGPQGDGRLLQALCGSCSGNRLPAYQHDQWSHDGRFHGGAGLEVELGGHANRQ